MGTQDIIYGGFDGCRAGWILCSLNASRRTPGFELLERWPKDSLERIACIAVDMPIGLPDSGRRRCDLEARALLPPRTRSRIFMDLRRPLLECPDYEAANRMAREDGQGLSKQAWNLHPRLCELDAFITPARQARVLEAHPELVFHRLNDWHRLANKKTAEGRRHRLHLLARAGLEQVERAIPSVARNRASPDDFLDAAACALAASWSVHQQGHHVPSDSAETDSRGLRMEIHF
ncbi:DUF429 domain-containing protein [Fodinicurvata halophila]|uniref:DUF429 domain-containing protein n=1 Tax=Fodinicurvata halophila TaxID=1419723 RepID=A0ABV8URR5_9PROT